MFFFASGDCVDGFCFCTFPFYGATCQESTCPGGCGAGTCDVLSGAPVCVCPRVNGTHWYYGASCEEIAEGCPPCAAGSTCDGTQCVCGANRRGQQCEIRVCPGYSAATNSSNCAGNGMCQEDGTCVCEPGYVGEQCADRGTLSTSSGLSTGVIVGIVVGVLAAAALAAFVGALIHRQRTQKQLNKAQVQLKSFSNE